MVLQGLVVSITEVGDKHVSMFVPQVIIDTSLSALAMKDVFQVTRLAPASSHAMSTSKFTPILPICGHIFFHRHWFQTDFHIPSST